LAVARQIDDLAQAFDEELGAARRKLLLQQRALRAELLGQILQAAPNRGQPDMVFSTYGREHAGFDQVRERQAQRFRIGGADDGAERTQLTLMGVILFSEPGAQG